MTAKQLQKMLDGLGISQTAAAKDLGISARQMRRYCSGEAKIPQVVELAMMWIRAGSREGHLEGCETVTTLATETLTWHPASEPPDADTTVLLSTPDGNEPTWLGYWDGELWCSIEGFPYDSLNGIRAKVVAWAEMPQGVGK